MSMNELVLVVGIERVTLDATGAMVSTRGYNRIGQRVLVQDFLPSSLARYLNLEQMRRDGVGVDDRRPTPIGEMTNEDVEDLIARATYTRVVYEPKGEM